MEIRGRRVTEKFTKKKRSEDSYLQPAEKVSWRFAIENRMKLDHRNDGMLTGRLRVVCGFLWFLLFSPVVMAATPPIAPNSAGIIPFNLNSQVIQLVRSWRMKDGDDPEWRLPGFDDSGWPAGSPNQLPQSRAGVHWLRAHVVLTGTQSPFDVLVLRFSKLPIAFDVYWDGLRVGENGRVGHRQEDEIPGQVAFMIKLPRELTAPGPHLLGVRYSNFHKSLPLREFWAAVAYHADWLLERAKDIHLQYLWLGIYLTSTLLSFALFLGGGRHRAFLVFAIYSFLLTLYLAINPILEMVSISILSFNVLFAFRYLAFLCAGILLNVFFVIIFEIPRKKIHIPVVILLALLIDVLKIRHLLGIDWRDTALISYAIGLLVYAVKQRKAGSLIALLGLFTSAVPVLYETLNVFIRSLPRPDPRVILALSFLFIPSIIFSISWQIREQNRLYEAARNRSQRLETELLKSQIHPHFISNTLHAARSWIREDPRKAEKLLQTLSDEFQLISAISSRPLIPLAEEIRLCEYHLQIMGFRRDAHFELITENVPDHEEIPPLIFHTLIENGLTHAFQPRESGRFWLRHEKIGQETVFTIKNNGSRLRDAASGQSEIREGLGSRYVKARLEESFPGKWTVEHGIEQGLWKVTIRIKSRVP